MRALEVNGQPPSLDQLAHLTGRLQDLNRNSDWWLGDALAYAAEHHGDLWYQLVQEQGGTPARHILDLVLVSQMFPPDRRLPASEDAPGLSWYQHRLFVSLYEAAPKKATALMKRAASGLWDDQRIVAEIKSARAIETTGDPAEAPAAGKAATTVTATISITVDPAGKELVEELLNEARDAAVWAVTQAGVTVTSVSSRMSGAVGAKGEEG